MTELVRVPSSKFCGEKRIAISEDNYRKLQKLGDAGDSFNDVITRLVEGAQKNK